MFKYETGKLGRIAIAEDSRDLREAMKTYLELEGYTVDAYADGTSLMAGVKANPPDIVLTDLNMPEVTGYEVISFMHKHPKLMHIPIIAVTGMSAAVLNVMMLNKPFDLDDLIDCIEVAMERVKTERRVA